MARPRNPVQFWHDAGSVSLELDAKYQREVKADADGVDYEEDTHGVKYKCYIEARKGRKRLIRPPRKAEWVDKFWLRPYQPAILCDKLKGARYGRALYNKSMEHGMIDRESRSYPGGREYPDAWERQESRTHT